MATATTLCLFISVWAATFCLGETFLFFNDGELEVAWKAKEYVSLGDILDANCTMTKYNGPYDASHIYFQLGEVKLPDVKVLSPRKARLFWRTTEKKSIHLYCYVNESGEAKTLDHKVVTIGEPPERPSVPKCMVYNWEKMVCSWTPTYEEQARHVGKITNSQDLIWSVLPKDGEYKCKHMGRKKNTCTWKSVDGQDSFRADMVYYMRVHIRNPLGSQSSPWVRINTSDIVKPNPVFKLELHESKTSKRNLTVSWPSPAVSRDLVYSVYYQSQWEPNKDSWQVKRISLPKRTNSTLVTCTLTNLVPYTNYNIKVSAKPQTAGFWSENTTLEKARTLDDVPAAHPQVTRGGFEIREEENRRIAVIHWKNVPKRKINGPWIKYWVMGDITEVVDSRPPRDFSKQVPPGELSYNISLSDDEGAELAVEAMGQAGVHMGTAQKIRIEPQKRMPPGVKKLVVISYSKTVVQLSWKKIPETDVLSYTVYWCKGYMSEQKCYEELQWKVLPATIDKHNITLPSGERYGEYLFAVSAESGESSSGMVWSQCSYEWNGVVHPPKNVNFTSHQEFRSLTFRWKEVTCSPDYRGYITSFIIRWCPVTKDRECIGDMKNVSVSGDLTEYTLQGLWAHQEYWVDMISITANDRSHPSYPIFKTTTDTWLTGSVIAGLTVACFVGNILLVAGLVTSFLRCKKCHNWCVRPVEITLPDKVKDPYDLDVEKTNYTTPNDYVNGSMNGHVNKYVNTSDTFVNSNEIFKTPKSFYRQISIDSGRGSLSTDDRSSHNDSFQRENSMSQRSSSESETASTEDVFVENGTAVQGQNPVILCPPNANNYVCWDLQQNNNNKLLFVKDSSEKKGDSLRKPPNLPRVEEEHDMSGEFCAFAVDNPGYSVIATAQV